MSTSMNLFDTARCRARIAGMRDEELDDYILRVKTRLVQSREDSYFLEESLLLQLGEACEERRRRQARSHSTHHRHHQSKGRHHQSQDRHEVQQGAD